MSSKFRSKAQLIDGKWVWKTKTGKTVERTQEQMDEQKRLLEKARKIRKEKIENQGETDAKPIVQQPVPVPSSSTGAASEKTNKHKA